MKPRLHSLGPYLGLLRPYAWWVAAGLALAVVTLSGSWALLGLSGGFLTATGLAGLVPEAALLFNVVVPAGAIRLFALARTVGRWSERVVNHEVTFRLLGQLRVSLYQRFSRLSPRQLGLWHGAEVLNRLTKDVDHLDNLYVRLLVPIGAATVVLASLVALLGAFAPVLAVPAALVSLVGLLVVPLAVYLPGRVLSPRLVRHQEALRRGLLDLVEALEEWSLHRPAWDRQRALVLDRDDQRLADQARFQRRGAAARALVTLAVGLGAWTTLALVVALPEGRLDGPWAVALVLLVLGMTEALLGLPAAWMELPGTALSAQRLTDLADQQPSPAYPESGPEPQGPLELNDVHFAYEDGGNVLEGLSLTLAPGDHLALLGPSGQGKTTLVRLVTRLEDPTSGTITVGGVPLARFPEPALRRWVSCSLQDPWIFSATLADNLRLAAPEATLDELWHFVDLVGLGDQVRVWPEGLNTWVEEGGQSLSGGQRRRLALARALLRRAPVTILDEPTEGLEAEAAEALVKALRAELAGRTLVWVTHRPEGLGAFDRVLKLENGRLS